MRKGFWSAAQILVTKNTYDEHVLGALLPLADGGDPVGFPGCPMSAGFNAAADVQVLTVAQFNARARALIEGGLAVGWVTGEISNFMRAASGHCYFSLKDESAQVRCVLFRHRAQLVDAPLANGARVEVRAMPTLYEARGEFQLTVEFVRRAGVGSLFEAFERTKRKLEAEGLFAPERKRPLPAYPRVVGIVTSAQAAALRDVLTTLKRRMPSIGAIVYPTLVQGEGAPERIAGAILTASRRAEVDVLIVCRGGGSTEDLWAFNDERVARAIAASPVPVVTGIGHETDFTIADFVSDMRAPTPTAAATAVVPDRVVLLRRIGVHASAIARSAMRHVERRAQRLDHLASRLQHPGERIALRRERLANLRARLANATGRVQDMRLQRVARIGDRLTAAAPDVSRLRARVRSVGERLPRAGAGSMSSRTASLDRLATSLLHLDPAAVLDRGYAIVRDARGRILRAAAGAAVGDAIDIRLADGGVDAVVSAVRRD
jgi:exodeoxyribonuclease VII large subunit